MEQTTTLPGVDRAEPRDTSRSEWFTPPTTAERIVDWALVPYGDRARGLSVLEPSAGHGALAVPLRRSGCEVACIDVDLENCQELARLGFGVLNVDFLEFGPLTTWKYDLCVANPPFENGQAELHLMHALKFARRAVFHVPLTTFEGQRRKSEVWDRVILHRFAICSTRPKYGKKGGATAMMTIDVSLRLRGDETPDNPEVTWWP